jgi:hypothetical protein
MKRVRVDFNSLQEDRTLRAANRAASEPLAIDDVVIAYDPEEADLKFSATVLSLDDHGIATLEIDWNSRVQIDRAIVRSLVPSRLIYSPTPQVGSGSLSLSNRHFYRAQISSSDRREVSV